MQPRAGPLLPPLSPGVPPFYVSRTLESATRVRAYSEARGSDGGAQRGFPVTGYYYSQPASELPEPALRSLVYEWQFDSLCCMSGGTEQSVETPRGFRDRRLESQPAKQINQTHPP